MQSPLLCLLFGYPTPIQCGRHISIAPQFLDEKNGVTYGPYSSLSSDFNLINLKTINFPHDGRALPLDDPAHLGTTWRYEVQWYPGGDESQTNVIMVESKPRNLGTFGLVDISLWTSSDAEGASGSGDAVTASNPIALYVRVARGRSPVMDARDEIQQSSLTDFKFSIWILAGFHQVLEKLMTNLPKLG